MNQVAGFQLDSWVIVDGLAAGGGCLSSTGKLHVGVVFKTEMKMKFIVSSSTIDMFYQIYTFYENRYQIW